MTQAPHAARRRSAVLSAGLLLSAAGWAAATETIWVPGIPDFDQRRTGVANNGAMHCVPASSINMMAYIANYGYSPVMGGPRNWQSQSEHEYVSSSIALMGALMGTGGSTGTTGAGWETGLNSWLNATAPGLFTVTRRSVGPWPHYVTPYSMYGALFNGSMVSFAYGRYVRPNESQAIYQRSGGHAVTLAVCTLSTTPGVLGSLQWRDPATDDGNLSTQSPFSMRVGLPRREAVTLTGGTTRTMYRLLFEPPPDGSMLRFIDSLVIVDPHFAITTTPTLAVAVHRPIRMPHSLQPLTQVIAAPAGLSARRVMASPEGTGALVVTDRAGTTPPKLWHLTLHDGGFDDLWNLPAETTPVVVSRHNGEIYTQNVDGLLIYYKTIEDAAGNKSLAAQASRFPPSPIGAVCYNDATDEVVAFLPGTRQLCRYSRTLGGPTTQMVLGIPNPQGTVMGIEPQPMAGKYFLRIGQSIYALRTANADSLTVESTLALPANMPLQAFSSTDRGTLLMSINGQAVEYELNAAGSWGPKQDSIFLGLNAGVSIASSRSRSNYDPALHGIPGWELIIDDVPGPETPDCSADFDCDGDIGTDADIQAFFACLGGNCPPLPCTHTADVDGDGDIGTDADIEAFFRVLAGGAC